MTRLTARNDYWYAGGDGVDTVYGLAGNDTIYGGQETRFISGGSGHDYLYAGDGNVATVLGGNGNDIILAGNGSVNDLRGGWGDDTFDVYCSSGSHTDVRGGREWDTFKVTAATDGWTSLVTIYDYKQSEVLDFKIDGEHVSMHAFDDNADGKLTGGELIVALGDDIVTFKNVDSIDLGYLF
jgi:Ca2+-binding RTX toxin-like protein